MFPRWGTGITRDMCFLGGGAPDTWDMCFPGEATPITWAMCFPDGEHIKLMIFSQVGEHIKLLICVSQLRELKSLKGYVFPRWGNT